MVVYLENLKVLLSSHHTVPFHNLGCAQEACKSRETKPFDRTGGREEHNLFSNGKIFLSP